jgi:hypothetical protein
MTAKSVHECNNNNVQLRLQLKTRTAHVVSINVSLIIFVESFVAIGRNPVRFLKDRPPVTVSFFVEEVPGRFPEIAMAKLITSSILQRRRHSLAAFWLFCGFVRIGSSKIMMI